MANTASLDGVMTSKPPARVMRLRHYALEHYQAAQKASGENRLLTSEGEMALAKGFRDLYWRLTNQSKR